MNATRNLITSLDGLLSTGRAFDDALLGSRDARAWVPAMDVAERQDAYVVHAELAGVSPEQVDIQFEQNILTIRGTKPASFDRPNQGELRVFAAERAHGSFERAVRLPEFADAEKIDAQFANGLLTVTVPKAKAAQARKIAIRSAEVR